MDKTIIPQINLHLSKDLYYEFLKEFSPGFGWSIKIPINKLQPEQVQVLQALCSWRKLNYLGNIQVCFSCTKIGKEENKTVGVTEFEYNNGLFKLGDTY